LDFVVTDLDDDQRSIGGFIIVSDLRGHAIGAKFSPDIAGPS
jgi:hypothetical protein